MDSRALEQERKATSTSGNEALDHAIEAAGLYMEDVQKATTAAERTRLGRKCGDMLDLAEKLKTLLLNRDPPGPKSARQLSTPEKTIILRSSKIHGKVFPPWEAAPESSAFAKVGGEMYMDSYHYTFSSSQKDLFTGWKHPSELLTGGEGARSGSASDDLMTASAESDLVQDMLTDCSVVASLSASMRHLCRGKDSLLASLMYPYDHKASKPAVSANGKYVFRMNFNGCTRKVTIDDRLPSSTTSLRALFVVDQSNPRLIWPALMEKAYLKIRGGYDFPGSNSGTDLYVLTGWIPEQLFFQHEETDLEHTWTMMKKGFDNGNVVVTLGTSYLTPEEEETIGLVSEHDYAVMDLREGPGARRMLVKNPWRNSVVWKGVGSSASMNVITSSPSLPSKSGATPDEEHTGTFWMPFEDVAKNFDSLYLNWNPTLFTHRQDHHFVWEMPSTTVANALAHNPQYSVQTSTSGPVWILLSRHWQDGELDILRRGSGPEPSDSSSTNGSTTSAMTGSTSSSGIPTLASVSKTLGFMSLAVYASSPPGTRVSLPDRAALHRSIYVDSPNTLLRLDKPTPNRPYTIAVTHANLPLPKYSFTLSFFSTAPLTVSKAAEPLPHTTEVQGAWTRRSAGGNTASPTYHTNPQFALTVPPSPAAGTRLSLLLTTDADDLPVNVVLLHSDGGARVTAAANRRRDIVAASPEYRRGAAITATALVPPGTYTAVVSTFEPDCLARFVLRVAADGPITVATVAPEAAGRLRTEARPLPLDGPPDDDAGFVSGTRRAAATPTPTATLTHRAPITVARLTRLSVVAVAQTRGSSDDRGATTPPPPSAVRVSVELGSGPHRSVLAVTAGGEFADSGAAAGLRTVEVDVDPGQARARGGLWVVVERVAGGARAGGRVVLVEVLSDGAVRVGGWECVGG